MKVCLFADHKYNDNNGAYTVFTLFDTVTKEYSIEGGMYSDLAYNHYVPTGDLDVIFMASQACTPQQQDGIYNKYAGRYHYAGCVVTLKRSRKAPNKTPLLVVGDRDGGYNSMYNNYQPDEIMVKLDDGSQVWVSVGCISEIVEGVYNYPIWYITEAEYNKNKFNCKKRKTVNNSNRLTHGEKQTVAQLNMVIDKSNDSEKTNIINIVKTNFPKLYKFLEVVTVKPSHKQYLG